MKRATIAFSGRARGKLEACLAEQRTPPSLSTALQVALEECLDQKWLVREMRLPTGPLELTVADVGDIGEVESDVSANVDWYLSRAIYEQKVLGTQRRAAEVTEVTEVWPSRRP